MPIITTQQESFTDQGQSAIFDLKRASERTLQAIGDTGDTWTTGTVKAYLSCVNNDEDAWIELFTLTPATQGEWVWDLLLNSSHTWEPWPYLKLESSGTWSGTVHFHLSFAAL